MALTQMNVDPNVQNIVTGVLLLLSVVIPNGGELVRRVRAGMRRLSPGV
jgi:rhamnose transport system permease protein